MQADAATLVLIPAKGGSVRLSRKNLRDLGGRPLIQWAIDAAREAGVAEHIVVSTEDAEVAEVAQRAGAEVPFMRPGALARDPAGVVDVALHVLVGLRELGRHYTRLVILLPTCPFRSAADIREACALFDRRSASFLMSVSRYDHTPFAAMRLDGDELLAPLFPEYIGRKSQDMPSAVRCNGAIHVLDVAAFENQRSYYAQPLIGYEMPWQRSIDIDTEHDLRLAESLLGHEK